MKVSEQDIQRDSIFIFEEDDSIKGFYHFRAVGEEAELVWLFIKPASIGKGIGKSLWQHLMNTIKGMHIQEFIIKSDPHAEEFYLRLGAKRIGLAKSTVNEHLQLPLLKYKIE
nr:GNAT family N-acetyltransferase [Paenibacillus foliorum]